MNASPYRRMATLAEEAGRHALARAIARGSTRTPRRAGVVLAYHGIAETSGDLHRYFAPPLALETFRAELRHLRRHYDVVSIHELRERVTGRSSGDRFAVALTFDDDLESHHTFAAPLLAELGLPATFFLTGSSVHQPSAFWWHDLEDVFQRGGHHWLEVTREIRGRWGSVPDTDLRLVAKTMEMMPPHERDALAARLRAIVDAPPRDRGLRASAVVELVAAGFEIGFHTRAHYHPLTLDDDALRRAMREGTDELSAIAGNPLQAIAYPHGLADLRIAGAAAAAGFELGFVLTNFAVDASSHPMLLDRVDGLRTSPGAFAFRMARVISAV